MTSSERRVGLVRARARRRPARRARTGRSSPASPRQLGYGDAFAWRDAAAVFDEFAACTAGRPCDMTGISHERLRREGGVQWPCPAQAGDAHPGTRAALRGPPLPDARRPRALRPHAARRCRPRRPDPDFPLLLTTGRVADQWHTMTRTGQSPALRAAAGEPTLSAATRSTRAAAGVEDGELVRVVSRRGELRLRGRARRHAAARRRVRALPLGRAARAGRRRRAQRADDRAPSTRRPQQPELKAVAVRLEPVRRRDEPVRRRAPVDAAAARRRRHRDGRPRGRRGGAAPPQRRAAGRSSCSARSRARSYNRVLLSKLLARHVRARRARAAPAVVVRRARRRPARRLPRARRSTSSARARHRRGRRPPRLRRARHRDRLARRSCRRSPAPTCPTSTSSARWRDADAHRRDAARHARRRRRRRPARPRGGRRAARARRRA